jgi:MFS family permease
VNGPANVVEMQPPGPDRRRSGRVVALAAVFVANGLGIPSFLARLAERQADLGLSDAALGVTVLGTGAGALLASPVAGWAVHRHGSRPVTTVAGIAAGATLPLAALAPSAPTLFAALAVAGAGDAAMDIAMNANGAAAEAEAGRSILHRLHASWSLGALLAAGVAAAAASADVPLGAHLAVVGSIVAALAVVAHRHLVPTDAPPGRSEEHRHRRIPPAIVVIGIAIVAGAVLEGTAFEWSAIQADRLGLSTGTAPLGAAALSAGMFAGRLVGDRRTDRHGAVVVLRRGMLLSATGLALGSAIGEPLPFLAGIALAGFGLAPFFPLAFSAAVRAAGGAGAAVVSLGARAGFLVEPVLVGAVAEATDLRVSFAIAAVVAAGLAAAAARVVGGQSRRAT